MRRRNSTADNGTATSSTPTEDCAEGDPDLGLRFGLERILDGIATRIEARSRH